MKYKLNPLPDKPGWFQLESVREFHTFLGHTVVAGELGGQVQSESCLSQEDDSWIDLGSTVDLNSVIGRHCRVSGRSNIVQSKVEDTTQVIDSYLGYSRVIRANIHRSSLTSVYAERSGVSDSDLCYCNLISSSANTGSHLTKCELYRSDVYSAYLDTCKLTEASMNLIEAFNSEWTRATCPMVIGAFSHYKACIAAVGKLGVGCQIYTFEEWQDHARASEIMREADGGIEAPGDWERFTMALEFLKTQHDRYVKSEQLKPFDTYTPHETVTVPA